MNTIETIAARRSIRKFTDYRISDDEIKTLLTAGMNAPSARNTKPWHFMVIKEKTTINKMIECCPNGALMKGADTAILVMGDLNLTDDYFVIDCSAAVQNILLAAHELKLGSCWIGVYPVENRVSCLKKLFSLPEHIIPHSLIALGKPAESKTPNNNYREERVHTEKW